MPQEGKTATRACSRRTSPVPVVPTPKLVFIPAAARVLSARQVRELLGGKSEMFLYRMVTERPQLKFPRPFKINGRNHWHRAEIEGWIGAQKTADGEAA
jgi:predicted DNA-binding transcriptional regulator AlpA